MGMFGWQDYADVGRPRVIRKVQRDRPAAVAVARRARAQRRHRLLRAARRRPARARAIPSWSRPPPARSARRSARSRSSLGCRTVGIAGGPVKVTLCREAFGYDAAIDYKAAGDLAEALAAACPQRRECLFRQHRRPDQRRRDAAARASVRAWSICGTASIASWDPPPMGPRVERHLLVKRARMAGLHRCSTTQHRYEEAVARLAALDSRGAAALSRGHPGRHRRLPGCHRRPLSRREPGKRLIRLHA